MEVTQMIQQYDMNFQRNSTEHKLLALIRKENLTTAQLVKQMGKTKANSANLRLQIGELSRKGYVKSVGMDHWQLTDMGIDACIILGGEPTPRQRNVKVKISTGTVVGTYDGKELGQTCHRKGAYDYMQLPSLMQGQQVYWRREFKFPATENLHQ
jgi:hypothetical protein